MNQNHPSPWAPGGLPASVCRGLKPTPHPGRRPARRINPGQSDDPGATPRWATAPDNLRQTTFDKRGYGTRAGQRFRSSLSAPSPPGRGRRLCLHHCQTAASAHRQSSLTHLSAGLPHEPRRGFFRRELCPKTPTSSGSLRRWTQISPALPPRSARHSGGCGWGWPSARPSPLPAPLRAAEGG